MCFHTCQAQAHKSPRPLATSQQLVRYNGEGETITPPEYGEAIQGPPVYDDCSTRLLAAATNNHTRDLAPAPSYGCGSSCTSQHKCPGKLLEQYTTVDVVRSEEEEEEEQDEAESESEEEEQNEAESESEAEKWRRLYDEAKNKYFKNREREEGRREGQRRKMKQQLLEEQRCHGRRSLRLGAGGTSWWTIGAITGVVVVCLVICFRSCL